MGKSAEFIGGLLLFTGLFTRLACIILGVDMFYITFFVGKWKNLVRRATSFYVCADGCVIFFTGPESEP